MPASLSHTSPQASPHTNKRWLLFLTRLLFCVLASAGSLPATAHAELVSASDGELAAVTGQALFMANKTPGTDISSSTTFYKMGLDAVMEVNMNIAKLQLGCGGINGPGCDIDIDNLSLSGLGCSDRPACSATMTRPFIEFAIKNDNNAATRQITGFRFSAEALRGLMSAGSNTGQPNGINSLSGYMSIAGTSGSTNTTAGSFTNSLSGRSTVGGCIFGCPAAFTTNNAPLALSPMRVDFNVAPFVINGRRMNSVALDSTATIPDMILNQASGSRSINVPGCIVVLILPVCNTTLSTAYFDTRIINAKVNIRINENIGLLHNIPLNNPFSLSAQSEDILWPGQAAAAQRGWWMSVSDPVQLGNLDTPDDYRIDISSVYPQFATTVSQYLYDHPVNVPFGSAIFGIIGIPITVNVPPINLAGYGAIPATFNNLPLGRAQDVQPNCWGTSKFC